MRLVLTQRVALLAVLIVAVVATFFIQDAPLLNGITTRRYTRSL
ncbi:MAG: hypothetical protein ABW022_23865 [Actinoplanes sp.]